MFKMLLKASSNFCWNLKDISTTTHLRHSTRWHSSIQQIVSRTFAILPVLLSQQIQFPRCNHQSFWCPSASSALIGNSTPLLFFAIWINTLVAVGNVENWELMSIFRRVFHPLPSSISSWQVLKLLCGGAWFDGIKRWVQVNEFKLFLQVYFSMMFHRFIFQLFALQVQTKGRAFMKGLSSDKVLHESFFWVDV